MDDERHRRRAATQRQNLPSREYRALLRNLVPSSPAGSRAMRGNKEGITSPETRVRSLLHKVGYRFRTTYWIRVEETRTRPDIVFTKQRLAVYIDGCFWHACPQHGNVPKTNRPYWATKLRDNVTRDYRAEAALRKSGWQVMRSWEHEDPREVVDQIRRKLAELAN